MISGGDPVIIRGKCVVDLADEEAYKPELYLLKILHFNRFT
jgi:hypothetical protein